MTRSTKILVLLASVVSLAALAPAASAANDSDSGRRAFGTPAPAAMKGKVEQDAYKIRKVERDAYKIRAVSRGDELRSAQESAERPDGFKIKFGTPDSLRGTVAGDGVKIRIGTQPDSGRIELAPESIRVRAGRRAPTGGCYRC